MSLFIRHIIFLTRNKKFFKKCWFTIDVLQKKIKKNFQKIVANETPLWYS